MSSCEWCSEKRDATCAGLPNVGPLSRMCNECRDRICKKDENGKHITISLEEFASKFKKEKPV